MKLDVIALKIIKNTPVICLCRSPSILSHRTLVWMLSLLLFFPDYASFLEIKDSSLLTISYQGWTSSACQLRGKVCGKLHDCCTVIACAISAFPFSSPRGRCCLKLCFPVASFSLPAISLHRHGAHILLECSSRAVILCCFHLPGCLRIAWSSPTSLLNTVHRASRQKYAP